MKESMIKNDLKDYFLNLLLSAPLPPPLANFPSSETFGVESVDSVRSKKTAKREKIPFINPAKSIRYNLCYDLIDQRITYWLQSIINRGMPDDKFMAREDIPDDFNLCFFNENILRKQNCQVILTDNPIIAHNMMNALPFKVEGWFSWISFWTPDNNLDRLDWRIFQNKKIYYYFRRHSGYSWTQTRDIALEILDKLRPKSGEAIASEVVFIAYNYDDQVPMFLCEEAFRKMDEKNLAEDIQPSALGIQQFPSISRKILIDPLLLEKTITLFYDGAAKDRTQLILDLVIAASQKRTSIQNVSPPEVPLKIIYIHQAIGSDNFFEKVRDSFAKQYPNPDPLFKNIPQTMPTELLATQKAISLWDPAIRCREYPDNSDDSNNAS
ncbi:MAG: hypothetical protein AB7F32_02030, partial [Victivallaceae bacterium]